MSRAYRIQVRESLRRVIKASDHISTTLELLEILPREQMGAMLAEELAALGFEESGDVFVREDNGVLISINPTNGEVTARAEISENVSLEKTGKGTYDQDLIKQKDAEKRLRERTRKELQESADRKEQQLTQKATEQLEGVLADLQVELDGVVNRVTAEALKRKAAQIGEIKDIVEDTENGSMTIILEV